jgi:hypothetical protein
MAQAPQFDPDFPAELRQPPPRAVQCRPGRRRSSVPGIVRLLLIAGCALLFLCVAELIFIQLTPAIPGRVIGMKTSTSIVHHGLRTRYTIDYSYSSGGAQIADSQLVPEGAFNSIHAERPIRVHAITIGSVHFSEIQLSPADYFTMRWPLWLGALCSTTVTIFFVLMLRRRGIWVSHRRLVRSGEPVFGQITNKFTQRGRGLSYCVNYIYDPADQSAMKRSMLVTAADYDQAVKNARVVILYDPTNPRRSVIYQYCSYRAI